MIDPGPNPYIKWGPGKALFINRIFPSVAKASAENYIWYALVSLECPLSSRFCSPSNFGILLFRRYGGRTNAERHSGIRPTKWKHKRAGVINKIARGTSCKWVLGMRFKVEVVLEGDKRSSLFQLCSPWLCGAEKNWALFYTSKLRS